MPSSGFWFGFTKFNLSPFVQNRIEFMEINHILFISSAQNIELSIGSSGSMTPSCRWYTFSDIYFIYHDVSISVLGILKKLGYIKYMHLVHMHIFTVASSKADNLSFAYCANSMESFGSVIFIKVQFGFEPNSIF